MNDKYLPYKVEDYTTDQDFIDWVVANKNHMHWQSWLEQHPELNDKIYEARSLVKDLKVNFEEIDPTKKELIWNNIDSKTKVKNNNIRKIVISLTAAAACLIFFYINTFQADQITTLDSLTSKTMEYSLPDDSKIILQQGSIADYVNKNFSKSRILKLEGQAFFKVKKGSRFIVETKQGSVEVLGTSFNVSTLSNELSVHCYTGKVRVYNGKKSSLLFPGEKINITSDDEKSIFEIYDDQPHWVGNEINISGKSVKQICKLIEEIYKKRIVTDKGVDTEVRFSGAIPTQNLEEALRTFTWPLKLKYTINGNEVKISKE